ncbi:hypothetical protein GQX74_015153 [Glossina fuscipes]|nr:hypothetical protein GQX74_015153 [Glossina fuscipes]
MRESIMLKTMTDIGGLRLPMYVTTATTNPLAIAGALSITSSIHMGKGQKQAGLTQSQERMYHTERFNRHLQMDKRIHNFHGFYVYFTQQTNLHEFLPNIYIKSTKRYLFYKRLTLESPILLMCKTVPSLICNTDDGEEKAFKYFTKNFSNSFQKRQSENYFEEYLNLCVKLIDSDRYKVNKPKHSLAPKAVNNCTANKTRREQTKNPASKAMTKTIRIIYGKTDKQKPVSKQAAPINLSQPQQRTSLRRE